MRIIKCLDYKHMSLEAAKIIADVIKGNPECVLGLATGSSPIGLYENLVKWYNEGELDFSRVKTVNLDEYKGLPRENEQSYYYFMNHHLFSKVNIDLKNTHLPDGMEEDVFKACKDYDNVIKSMGGIDIQLLGIGHDGHIGFNEPGTSFEQETFIVKLTEKTRLDNQRFFNSLAEVPTHAMTMGIKNIMQAKKLLLVASGKNKQDAVKKLLSGEITEEFPASILNKHNDVVVIIDEEAAGLL